MGKGGQIRMTMTFLEQVITLVGAVCAVMLGWELYKARAREFRGDHYHNKNWTSDEYFNHIKNKHPDIYEQYFYDEDNKDESA
jgi:hypothetical protein